MAASHYERYDRLVVPALAAPFFDAVVEPLADAPDGFVLDVACGTGATSRAVAAHHPDRLVVVTDIDRRAVRFARDACAGTAWMATSVDALALPDSSVAGVVCQQGAQFFPDPVAACRELARVAATDAVIVVLCWTSDGAALFGHLDDALMGSGAAVQRAYERPLAFDLDAWTAASIAAGLTTQSVDRIDAPLASEDLRALVEHFIEPSDDARRRAVEVAMATLTPAIRSGMTLSSVRLVHRRPRA